MIAVLIIFALKILFMAHVNLVVFLESLEFSHRLAVGVLPLSRFKSGII